jgi:hypothetical protein
VVGFAVLVADRGVSVGKGDDCSIHVVGGLRWEEVDVGADKADVKESKYSRIKTGVDDLVV